MITEEAQADVSTKSNEEVPFVVVLQSSIRKYSVRKRYFEIVKANRHRTNVSMELLKTEKNYMSDLTILITAFLQPIRKAKLVSKETLDAIFSNIEDIAELTSTILFELENRIANWGPFVTLGDIFSSREQEFSIYEAYITNFESASACLKAARTINSELNYYIEQGENLPECELKDITSFLIAPFQRLTRYSILLAELLKCTPNGYADHDLIQEAMKVTKKITWKINESKRRQDNLKILAQIDNRLTGWTQKLTGHTDRTLLREGFLQLQKGKMKRKPILALLFSDMFVIATPKQERYEVIHSLPLQDITCTLTPDSSGIEILLAGISFSLFAHSEAETQQWFTLLTQSIASFTIPKEAITIDKPPAQQASHGVTELNASDPLPTSHVQLDASTPKQEANEELRLIKKYLEEFLCKRPSLINLFERAILEDLSSTTTNTLPITKHQCQHLVVAPPTVTLAVSKSWLHQPSGHRTNHRSDVPRSCHPHYHHHQHHNAPLKVSKQWLVPVHQ